LESWIGDAGFTGCAYGLVGDTLSLVAGNVSIANLILRPEVIWALDANAVADSNSQLSFAPRFICESVTTTRTIQNCSGGAEIAVGNSSEDRLTMLNLVFSWIVSAALRAQALRSISIISSKSFP